MLSTFSPSPLPADAPAIVHELRKAFDQRMPELYAVARDRSTVTPNGNSPMYHVDMPFGALQVTAVYDREQDRFTQLIARAAEEAHHARPSFTISLFL
jgi:hypothetical protein